MIKDITTLEELDEFTKEGLVLVDIHAKWCPPCKAFGPVMEKVHKEHPGKFNALKVDFDENEEINEKFDVMSIPTLVLYKDGKYVKRHIGGLSEKDLLNFLGL